MPAKRTLTLLLALPCLALGACGGDDEPAGGGGGSGASAKAAVDIKEFKFAPEAVEVEAGGQVTFANADKAKHNAQTDAGAKGAFNTDDLQKGDSKAVTFDEPGTYSYYCIYHRFMTGTVEVSQ
jgi:plastocyanin